MIILPIFTTSLIHFLFKRLGERSFLNLGVKGLTFENWVAGLQEAIPPPPPPTPLPPPPPPPLPRVLPGFSPKCISWIQVNCKPTFPPGGLVQLRARVIARNASLSVLRYSL